MWVSRLGSRRPHGPLAGDPDDSSCRTWSLCLSSLLRRTLRAWGRGRSTEGCPCCEPAAEPGRPRRPESRSAQTAAGARHRPRAGRRRPGAGLRGHRSHTDLEQDPMVGPTWRAATTPDQNSSHDTDFTVPRFLPAPLPLRDQSISPFNLTGLEMALKIPASERI